MPSSELAASLLILVSAVLHAVVNVLTKISADPLLVRGCMNAVALVVATLLLPFVSVPEPQLWPILITSTLIHGLYPHLLVCAYRTADLSTAYPLARGSAPLFVLLIEASLNNVASSARLAGAIVVSVAVASLAFEPVKAGRIGSASIAAALATGFIVATYTILDAIGLRAAQSAMTYIVWLFILDGLFVSGTIVFMRRGHVRAFVAAHWRQALLAGVLGVLTYGLALFALKLGSTAVIAAMRETSILFAAGIAACVLKERFGRLRATASIAVVGGIGLMHWPQ